MGILAWISGIFTPAVDLVKNLHTSDADRMALENQLSKIKADVESKMIELEMEKIKLQEVEATSANWIVAAWRPISSIAIVGIIIAASFGLAHPDQKFYDLAQWFLVGYAGGRSLEKSGVLNAAGSIANKISKKIS